MTAKEAEAKVRSARSNLLMTQPFFGYLSMKLSLVCREDLTCNGVPTMATDGVSIYYHPEFVAKMDKGILRGTIAHEILHCSLGHIFRIKNLPNKQVANMAADYVINPIVLEAGLKLPEWALFDPKYKGMTMEQVYYLLMQDPPQDQSGGACVGGEFMEAPEQPQDGEGCSAKDQILSESNIQQEWRTATQQARSVARKSPHGNLSAALDQVLGQALESVTDWRNILWRFCQDSAREDYRMIPPDRRFAYQGTYLPSVFSEGMGRFPFFVDTSGSMCSPEDIGVAVNEINAIMKDMRPEAVDVVYIDSEVCGHEVFTPDDNLNLNVKGGGGTAFQPAFDWVEENYDRPPIFAIYLTDLEGPAPKDPGYPVLWITSINCRYEGPFGETIKINNWL